MNTEITYNQKKKIDSIGDCIKKFEIKKEKHCYYEWQDKAFDIANRLKIDFTKNKKELPKWLSLFKRAYLTGRVGKLENCYSFLIDYTKNLDDISKIRLFFWKFGQKVENKAN